MNFALARPLSAPGIYRSKGTSLVEFKSWLAKGDYRINSIAPSSEVKIYVTNAPGLMETFGYDFSRFACASYESVRDIGEDAPLPKATAWAAIRMYYAAFFAAHAILRFMGISCSQIEATQAKIVTRYADIYGINERMQSGFFCAVYDEPTRILSVRKLSDSHKDTWSIFKVAIDSASKNVLQVPGISSEKTDISDLLSRISESISTGESSSGNWLSLYRNNLNYRHAYDAWYPYRKSAIRFSDINKYIVGWQLEGFNPALGLLEKDERARFFGTCASILYVLRGLSSDLCGLASKGSVHSVRTARLMSM